MKCNEASDYDPDFANQRLKRYYEVSVPIQLKENAQDFHRRSYEYTYNILPGLKTFIWGSSYLDKVMESKRSERYGR